MELKEIIKFLTKAFQLNIPIIEEFKLQPADILVNVNSEKDLLSRLKRWAIGPYSHVFLYMGKVSLLTDWGLERIIKVPMLFESIGRGVCLRSLSERYGEQVVVMRLKLYENRRQIPAVITQAIKLASDLQAYYDYSVIAWHIIPRIFFEKLHLSIPLKYQRDEKQICSEAVAEVFWRTEMNILPQDIAPLPGDFVESSLLEQVWYGKLSSEIV